MHSKVKVFLNGHLDHSVSVTMHTQMTVNEFISDCQEKFSIDQHVKCKLFDSTGGELSDDDMQYLNSDEPLFLSRGEEFAKASTMALYEEIKKLGQGGFGTVHLYENLINRTKVAIKFVQIGSLISTEDVNRVYSEIAVLRNLKHPNIVHLIDAFTTDDKICFVMEYCSGGELAQYLNDKESLPETEVYSIALQMTEAIRYCHNSKVVHRDLKLENILFSSESHLQIKIVDFGIAGMFGPNNHGERSGAGSLLYLAPEVISGEDDRANPALDIWSMGCILYYLLSNTHPFDGETKEEVIKKINSGKYKPLSKEISKPWHILIKGMLRLTPSKRWNLLRITEHLYKHRYENDASLTEDSDIEIEESAKVKSSRNFLKVNRKSLEDPKKKSPFKRSPMQRSPIRK
jgi:serine/threonine protein kinase